MYCSVSDVVYCFCNCVLFVYCSVIAQVWSNEDESETLVHAKLAYGSRLATRLSGRVSSLAFARIMMIMTYELLQFVAVCCCCCWNREVKKLMMHAKASAAFAARVRLRALLPKPTAAGLPPGPMGRIWWSSARLPRPSTDLSWGKSGRIRGKHPGW